MELNINNLKKTLSEDLIKKAEQNVVRECDELKKGHFQAYVDQGEATYDVFLTINNKGQITDQGCDCSTNTTFCRHKAALAFFILQGKKATTVSIKARRKAVSPLEALIDGVDADQLRVWLKDLLFKNKDLGVVFTHHFSEEQKVYTTDDVRQIIVNAVKAVVKNKKKLEVGEVKKIVELWTQLLEPVLTLYHTQLADQTAFNNFNALIESCQEVNMRIITSSNRIVKFTDGLLLKVKDDLFLLKDEEAWDVSVGYFINQLYKNGHYFRVEYLSFLSQLYDSSDKDRKKRLALKLADHYQREYYGNENYTITVFNMIADCGLFETYFQLFQPLLFKNDFNTALIGLLIEHDQLSLAEQYCWDQIKKNYREEYDILYLEYLSEIYKLQNDEDKLAGVLKLSFPHNFYFTDYLFITDHIADEAERKKWRSGILARARNMASNYYMAQLFIFQLMDYEKKYTKMIDYIDSYTEYSVIIQFADKMAMTSKDGFWKKIFYRSNNYLELYDSKRLEKQQVHFAALREILAKQYTDDQLKLLMREVKLQNRYGMLNNFVVYLIEHLGVK